MGLAFLSVSPFFSVSVALRVAHYVRHTSNHRRHYRGEQEALGPDYLFIVDSLKIISNFAILQIPIWNFRRKCEEVFRISESNIYRRLLQLQLYL